MANQKIRRWRVEPDRMLETSEGVILHCSDEAIGEAVADGIAIVQRMGGLLQLTVERQPTDLRGEAVTPRAFVTYLPYAKAEEGNERAVKIAEFPEPADEPEPDPQGAELPEEDVAEEEEDVSAIPVELR